MSGGLKTPLHLRLSGIETLIICSWKKYLLAKEKVRACLVFDGFSFGNRTEMKNQPFHRCPVRRGCMVGPWRMQGRCAHGEARRILSV